MVAAELAAADIAVAALVAVDIAAQELAAVEAVADVVGVEQLLGRGGAGVVKQPPSSNPSPLQAGQDFPQFSVPDVVPPPPPIPQCPKGSRGTVGGLHVPVALAGPACPSASSGRARVERLEEEGEPPPQNRLVCICRRGGSAFLPTRCRLWQFPDRVP